MLYPSFLVIIIIIIIIIFYYLFLLRKHNTTERTNVETHRYIQMKMPKGQNIRPRKKAREPLLPRAYEADSAYAAVWAILRCRL